MKQTDKQGKKNEIGAYGEQLAAKYLENKGMKVMDLNYLKKWGEIDIVARETTKKGNMIRFVEVKAVSYETKRELEEAISRGTWRPEENITYKKIQRLNRAIDSWVTDNNYEGDWELDVIAVRLVTREKYASVKYLPGAVL